MAHKSKHKLKKYTVTLTEAELRRLSAYASAEGVERPAALHRLVSQGLRQYGNSRQQPSDRQQLGLFDAVQIDIFNNTSKV